MGPSLVQKRENEDEVEEVDEDVNEDVDPDEGEDEGLRRSRKAGIRKDK